MKRFAVAVATVLALMFGQAMSASPAAASWNACPDYHFCMWANTNYWGATYFAANPAHNVCFWALEGVSSIRNRLRYHVVIYNNTGCTGGFEVWPGQSFSPPPGYDGFVKFKVLN